MTEIVRHSLTDKDTATLTGNCSVCGFVAIRKAGNGYQCSVKKAQAQKSWRASNPEASRVDRRRRSEHELFNRDYRNLTAGCAACGREVDMVMFGAGYACGVRARQLRTVQQGALAGQKCRECVIIDGHAKAPRLSADGTCPRCTDLRLSDLNSAMRDFEYRNPVTEQMASGSHIEHAGFDAYDVPDYESAVPGWKTLGSSRPWSGA